MKTYTLPPEKSHTDFEIEMARFPSFAIETCLKENPDTPPNIVLEVYPEVDSEVVRVFQVFDSQCAPTAIALSYGDGDVWWTIIYPTLDLAAFETILQGLGATETK